MTTPYPPYSYGVLNFVKNQLFTRFHLPDVTLDGQTIIVTGSNVGLGFESAKHIAKLNAARIILAVRTISKGEEAASRIKASLSPNASTTIEVWPLAMDNYESIIDFAKRAYALDRVDTLIANAGVSSFSWSTSGEDEMHIKVNVIGTLLLALNLLPKLRESGIKHQTRTHLVIVTSEMHAASKFKEWRAEEGIFDRLNDKSKWDSFDRYPLSKLMEILFVRELAQQTPVSTKSPVIINLINPGLCHSKINRSTGFLFYAIETFKLLLAKSTIEGSITLVSGAVAGEETHGEYCSECVVRRPSPFVLSKEGQEAQKELFTQTLTKLESIQPGICRNISG